MVAGAAADVRLTSLTTRNPGRRVALATGARQLHGHPNPPSMGLISHAISLSQHVTKRHSPYTEIANSMLPRPHGPDPRRPKEVKIVADNARHVNPQSSRVTANVLPLRLSPCVRASVRSLYHLRIEGLVYIGSDAPSAATGYLHMGAIFFGENCWILPT